MLINDNIPELEDLKTSKTDELRNRRWLRVQYEKAIQALSTGASSYSIDTGQSRQTVTKANLGELYNMLKYLDSSIESLEYELKIKSSQPVTVIPMY